MMQARTFFWSQDQKQLPIICLIFFFLPWLLWQYRRHEGGHVMLSPQRPTSVPGHLPPSFILAADNMLC
jgi:hypothetical protein